MEIRDAESNELYGIDRYKRFEYRVHDIEDKFWLYMAKAALFILALHFIFWKFTMRFWAPEHKHTEASR